MLTVQTTETVWADRVPGSLTRLSFDALLNNEIPYIRIKNFAQATACENLVRLTASDSRSSTRIDSRGPPRNMTPSASHTEIQTVPDAHG
ncbi:MAG: hypothetical protein M0Z99_31245 [Betaproteobacteria bacterium]|nr:hypothetical protein [Betaproteobacteria bacterium]